MADREYREQHHIVEAEDGAHLRGHADVAEPASPNRYTSRGAIPPVHESFREPGPTASEHAFGHSGMDGRYTQAFGPAGAQTAQAAGQTQTSQPTGPASAQSGQATPGAQPGATSAQTPAEKRVEKMIGVLQSQQQKVTTELDAGAGKIDPALIAHMRRVLYEERGELLTALTNLPSGSSLQMEAFATSESATRLLTRLDAIAAAHKGHAATGAPQLQGDDKALVFQAAEKEAPGGYCDTAPQGVDPCELDLVTRDRYRRHVTVSVGKARENWKNAIAKAQIEEKLNQGKLTFEQQLGELLLGALFGVLGAGVKALAGHGLKKADKILTKHEWDDEIGVMQPKGVDPDALKLGQGIVDKTVEKGTPIAQAKLKEGITAQELAQQAKQPAPSDRQTFLASLKSAPDKWHDTIIGNLDRLFDADLAALVTALPLESPTISVDAFEHRISELVTNFEQQVLPVGQINTNPATAIKVVTAHGVRTALVANEQKPNKDMHGEWKWVPVNTGKMKFIRWIDDEMKEMAMARAREKDQYADLQMKSANDASYWDEDSLKTLAHDASATTNH